MRKDTNIKRIIPHKENCIEANQETLFGTLAQKAETFLLKGFLNGINKRVEETQKMIAKIRGNDPYNLVKRWLKNFR